MQENQKESFTPQFASYASSPKQISYLQEEEKSIRNELRYDKRRSSIGSPQNSPNKSSPLSIKK